MINCQLCHSATRESYLYTECNHLICAECASAKWDQKYSIRCCDKTTYLDDDTCNSLIALSADSTFIYQQQSKENLNPVPQPSKGTYQSTFANNYYAEQRAFTKLKQLEQSVVVREFQSPMMELVDEGDKRKEQNLSEMERILCDEVAKVKHTFDMQRKDLERREQILLKQIYNKYSDHLSGLKTSCSDQEVKQLREKLGKVTFFEASPPEKEQARQDKILQKLDYNQQVMREKLSKHYALLK